MRKTNITPEDMEVIGERFNHFDVPEELRDLIFEAMLSLNRGDFVYDGTTLDEELAPNNLEESSLLHDYMWAMGWGGHLSNLIYIKSLKVYKASKVTRAYRMIGISLGWYCIFIWKYIWTRNYRVVPERFHELYNVLKSV